MFKNPTLAILGLVMIVNALAYGMIIPLFYPFAAKFGLGPIGLGGLFASFSIAQFLATPLIGRWSDHYGRKPLLLGCLFGTSVALAMFGAAQSIWILFISRILDGITGGNMSVAQAIVADSTTGSERAKAFGMLGATFGLGFLLGPALGGVLSEISLSAPFYVAAIMGLIGTALGIVFLKETLPPSKRQKVSSKKPLFNFAALYHALFSPAIGAVLLITLLSGMAHNAFIIGFQAYTNDILKFSAFQVALIFTLLGVVNVFMQSVGLGVILHQISSKKKILLCSLIGSAAALALIFLGPGVAAFYVGLTIYMFVFAPQPAMTSGLISERTKAEDQGIALGINQSYMSLGQIGGPIVAGVATSAWSIHSVFGMASLMFVISIGACWFLFAKPARQIDL